MKCVAGRINYTGALKKLALKLLAALAVAALFSVVLFRRLNPEPAYQGRALSAWADDLRSGEPAARQHALEALKSSPEGVHFLSRRIAAGPGAIQRGAERIGALLPDRLKRPFRRIYDPGRELLDKHLAAQALQEFGTNAAPALSALGTMLHDPNALLASSAGATLARIGPSAVPVLIEGLEDPNFTVRSTACSALAQLSTNAADAVPALSAILQGESGPIVPAAAYALSQIRGPAIDAAILLLGSTNSSARRWGAFVLAQSGPYADAAIPSLLLSARETNAAVRAMAVLALGKISHTSRESAESLLAALEDPDENVRSNALTGLVERPSVVRRNVDRVKAMLDDPSPVVRSNAAMALGRAAPTPANEPKTTGEVASRSERKGE